MQASKYYQRVQIQFLTKLNIRPTRIHDHLRRAHGAAALSASTVYRWSRKFRSGIEDCKDAARPGRPTKLTDEKMRELTVHLNGDRRLSIRRLSHLCDLGVATVHKALRTVLQMKKRPARWVPHHLTPPQRQRRLDTCRQLLRMRTQDRGITSKVVTGDESWILSYDPAS